MENDTAQPVNQTEGVQEPSTTSAPSPEANPQQTASPASKGVNQADARPAETDWRQSPEFRGIAKENRRYKEQLTAMERKYAELEGKFSGFQSVNRQGQSSISQEDGSALERITALMLEHPKTFEMLKDKLGIGKIDKLEQGFNDLSQSWYSSQANTERESILANAKSIGLDPDEVSEKLDEALNEHPLYSQLNYKPGALKAVYRDLFFDQAGEFRERANNQETIKKREALKRSQTQAPTSQNGQPRGLSPDERFQKAVKDGGGLDFTR